MNLFKIKHIIIVLILITSNIVTAQTQERNIKKQSISQFYLEKANLYFQSSQYDSAAIYYKKSIDYNSNINEKNYIKSNHGYIIIASIGFILLLSLHFFLNLKNKSKKNKTLHEQNKQINSKSQEIEQQTLNIIKINEELERLSIAVNKTDNAILILNPEGDIEWINEGYTRLYGYTFEELIAQKGKNINRTNSKPKIQEIFNKVLTEKKSQIFESNVISKKNLEYRIHTTLTPVLNKKNEVERLIAIDSDVTKQRGVEHQLQELLVTKDKFFSIIAHDLKNPFNSLIGLSQLLVHGFDRMSTEKIKYFHKNLYQISKNGYELLINLLEWSRSQRGSIKFNPEKQDLNILTKETFSLFSSKASQKEISLVNNIGSNSFVFADKNMLKTIFRNLVSNALKFTDRGGAIEITEKIIDGFLEISIRDTGIGIEPENVKKLFKLGENYTTSGTEEESGTGLGLILCEEFVTKHGGEIWIESKLGFGSKFIFTLPINKY
jgi:PAS domain S-box-containing protein